MGQCKLTQLFPGIRRLRGVHVRKVFLALHGTSVSQETSKYLIHTSVTISFLILGQSLCYHHSFLTVLAHRSYTFIASVFSLAHNMAAKIETLPHVFDIVKDKFPKSLGPDRWYLIAVHMHALHFFFSPSQIPDCL